MTEIDIELIKLRSEALDKGYIKLATWGNKEQLMSVLRNGQKDPFHTDQKWMNLMDREYPKIETLYNRDGRYVVVGELRKPEFGIIKNWSITEKINGMNTRVTLFDDGRVEYGGRTDNANIPSRLLKYLMETFTPEKLKSALWLPDKPRPKKATTYGEGYGPNMNSGSGIYRKDVSFRLFDCLIEGVDGVWWLERANIEDIAMKLGVKCAPIIGHIDYLPTSAQQLRDILKESIVAREENGVGAIPEGIVAKSEPMVHDKKGDRVMWKLKMNDFKKE